MSIPDTPVPRPARSTESAQICAATRGVNELLLAKRNSQGWWTGQLSTSALSTATAVMACLQAIEANHSAAHSEKWKRLVAGGLRWLATHQNSDGGWGDTVLSISNISTTMLAHAVFRAVARSSVPGLGTAVLPDSGKLREVTELSGSFIERAGGVQAVVRRYGKDRTFSVPILTHCALAGIVEWKEVIPLPFELACIPHRLYAMVQLPVVSYALPALIAIGQVIFRHQGHRNPLVRWIRSKAIRPSLNVLEAIQPPNGGFLEATPLTSFVCMSLIGCGLSEHSVTQRCLRFIEASVRDDGSWPIDTNLSTWVTTLSVNAMLETFSEEVQVEGGISDRLDAAVVRNWLLMQQYRTVHPYTHAAPGGWSWTDLPGGVPDADDTPGAMLALLNLRSLGETYTAEEVQALENAATWLLDLQNRDGGWPTFCRGWGALPFDRSSCDLTAHALRALWKLRQRIPDLNVRIIKRTKRSFRRGLSFLKNVQRPDGTWLPLWFGHQFNEDDENPLYGTSRVVRAMSTIGEGKTGSCRKAVQWLLANQNADGGWSARRGLDSSVEETGLALDSLADFVDSPDWSGVRAATDHAAAWLAARVDEGTVNRPSPIGFYFARLWYFEDLYPIIFASAGLNRWRANLEK